MLTKERVKFVLDSTSSLAVIVAASAVVWMALQSRAQTTGATRKPAPTWIDVNPIVTTASAITSNRSKATVAVVEFSDFQCPFCGRFAAQTFPELKRQYIDTGKVEYIFRNFPLDIHPFALHAAYAGVCAAKQGQFHAMHDRLFGNQRALADPDLMVAASDLRLDKVAFERCMTQGAAVTISADRDEGERLKVNGTPTIMLGRVTADGRVTITKRGVGAVSFDAMKAEIEKLLAKSTP